MSRGKRRTVQCVRRSPRWPRFLRAARHREHMARGNLPTSRGFFQVPVAQAREGIDLPGMKKDDVSVEVARRAPGSVR